MFIANPMPEQIGADIIFAFDELTTLNNTRDYQVMSLERTRLWAERCIAEHDRLRSPDRPYQALYGVIQGAQYEDLRRTAARDLGSMPFDGYGIGGAIEKRNLSDIVGWVTDELPDDKPRHLLGIGEPGDLFKTFQRRQSCAVGVKTQESFSEGSHWIHHAFGHAGGAARVQHVDVVDPALNSGSWLMIIKN